jgi:hypothetical protein
MDFQKLTLERQPLEGVLQLVERGSPNYEGDVAMATAVSGRRFATAAALPAVAGDDGRDPGDVGIEQQLSEIQSALARLRRARASAAGPTAG